MVARRLVALVLLGSLAATAFLPHATAHEQFDAGRYTIEVGWLYEPPVVDQPNAITVTVEDSEGGNVSADDVALTPEVHFGSHSKSLSMEGSDDEEGLFTAAIVPTEEGEYTVTISGSIGTTPVSHEVKLDEVAEPSESAFPESHPTTGDLHESVQMLQWETLGLGGLALLFSIVAFAVAMSARSRRNQPPQRR